MPTRLSVDPSFRCKMRNIIKNKNKVGSNQRPGVVAFWSLPLSHSPNGKPNKLSVSTIPPFFLLFFSTFEQRLIDFFFPFSYFCPLLLAMVSWSMIWRLRHNYMFSAGSEELSLPLLLNQVRSYPVHQVPQAPIHDRVQMTSPNQYDYATARPSRRHRKLILRYLGT